MNFVGEIVCVTSFGLLYKSMMFDGISSDGLSRCVYKTLPYFTDMSTPGISLVRFSTRGTRVGGVHRTDGGYISRFVFLNFYWFMGRS